MRRVKAFDMPLFIFVLMMTGLGIICIYSSSYPKALISSEANDNAFYFAGKQIIFSIVGCALMLACMYLPLDKMRRLFWALIGIGGFLLLFTLIICHAKHGHQSYIEIRGMQFMPSEFVKICLVFTMATFLSRRPWKLRSWKGMWSGPYWFLIIPTLLIGMEQDLGTMLVMVVATACILLIAGAKFRFVGMPLAALGCVVVLLVASGHCPQRVTDRVKAWLHTEDFSNPASYHPRISQLAIGSGGVLGMGFCKSRMKWSYLPAAQNDYILAITAEEWGFIWTLLLLFAPLIFIMYRGFSIAHRAPDEYTALVAAGSTVMLIIPALINIAMVLNCLPSIGVNLPFISYGGSSITSTLMLCGLLLNVSTLREEPQTARAAQSVPAT